MSSVLPDHQNAIWSHSPGTIWSVRLFFLQFSPSNCWPGCILFILWHLKKSHVKPVCYSYFIMKASSLSVPRRDCQKWSLDKNARQIFPVKYQQWTVLHEHIRTDIRSCVYNRGREKQTYSSKTTAQSGRKSKWVSPAPCIPMNISELWVILSCSENSSSLQTIQ